MKTDDASSYVTKAVARILDPRFVTQAAGLMDLSDNPTLSLRLILDSAAIKEAKTGFFEGGTLPLQEGFQVLANTFPEKSTIATGMLKCNVRQMLLLFERSMDEDTRKLLGDLMRDMTRYAPDFTCSGTVDLIDRYLDPLVKDTVYFCFAEPKFFLDPLTNKETAPHPWPLVAFLFELDNEGPFDVLEKAIIAAQKQLKIEKIFEVQPYKDTRPELKFKEAKVQEELEIESICWGVINDVDKKYFLITTSTDFFTRIMTMRYFGQHGGIGTSATFRIGKALLDEQRFANLFAIVDFTGVRKVASAIVNYLALQETVPDWTTERARARDEIVRTRYAEYQNRPLPPDTEESVKKLIEQRMQELDHKYKTEVAPHEAERKRAALAGLDLLRNMALTMRVNEGNLDLNLILSTAANR
jgi:hypothetical protein